MCIRDREYAITLLWEDREYDSRVKGLYRKAVSMMRAAFRDAGCEDLCLYYRSSLAANIRAFYCDYYEYMKGDAEMRRSFFDNYMTDYLSLIHIFSRTATIPCSI